MDQAVSFAEAVNLRADDLPYFEEDKEKDEEAEEDRKRDERLKRDFGRCLGGIDVSSSMLYHRSPAFENPAAGEALLVESAVEVAASAALAERRADAYRSRRGKRCIAGLLIPIFREEGSTEFEIGKVTVSRLDLETPEIDGVFFAYRISTTVNVTGAESQLTAYVPGTEAATPQTVPFFIDLIGFTVGPAEVNLTAMGAPAPVSRNFEANLLTVLHERALASLP